MVGFVPRAARTLANYKPGENNENTDKALAFSP